MDENYPKKKAFQRATDAKTCTNKVIASIIDQVLISYSTLLMEEQDGLGPNFSRSTLTLNFGQTYLGWITPRSVQHNGHLSQSSSHSTCKLTAKVQRFYISEGLKKSKRVSISNFMLQCHNRYLDLLLVLQYSSKAVKPKKVVGSSMIPIQQATSSGYFMGTGWQDKYEISGVMVLKCQESRRSPGAHQVGLFINKDHEGPKNRKKPATLPKARQSPLTKGFIRNFTRTNIVCFASNIGVHKQPTTLQNSRKVTSTPPPTENLQWEGCTWKNLTDL